MVSICVIRMFAGTSPGVEIKLLGTGTSAAYTRFCEGPASVCDARRTRNLRFRDPDRLTSCNDSHFLQPGGMRQRGACGRVLVGTGAGRPPGPRSGRAIAFL